MQKKSTSRRHSDATIPFGLATCACTYFFLCAKLAAAIHLVGTSSLHPNHPLPTYQATRVLPRHYLCRYNPINLLRSGAVQSSLWQRPHTHSRTRLGIFPKRLIQKIPENSHHLVNPQRFSSARAQHSAGVNVSLLGLNKMCLIF